MTMVTLVKNSLNSRQKFREKKALLRHSKSYDVYVNININVENWQNIKLYQKAILL